MDGSWPDRRNSIATKLCKRPLDGDKRQLYLKAFRRYVADSINEQIGYLEKSSYPLAAIEKMLLAFATRTLQDLLRTSG
jgi:hypothetical protein